MEQITVFGATGRVGGVLVRLLSERGVPVTAVTRDLSKAVERPGVTWVRADMGADAGAGAPDAIAAAPAALAPLAATMAGSTAVFLASAQNAGFAEAHQRVIAAAAQAGIPHLVQLSSAAADAKSPLQIGRVHGEVEAALTGSGIAYTILRPTGFMQNWLGSFSDTVKRERRIYEATGLGKRAYIDGRDIAEVALEALLHPDCHAGRTYTLTGGEAVHFEQIATWLTKIVGEPVTYVQQSEAEAGERMAQKGLPPWAIQTLLAYARDQREGRGEWVSPSVGDVLGRPPRTVEAFLYEYRDFFGVSVTI